MGWWEGLVESDFNGVNGTILLSLYSYNFHIKIQLNYFPSEAGDVF